MKVLEHSSNHTEDIRIRYQAPSGMCEAIVLDTGSPLGRIQLGIVLRGHVRRPTKLPLIKANKDQVTGP